MFHSALDCYRESPVLVTGATGFIGGHLARALMRLGADVTILVHPDDDDLDLLGHPVERIRGSVTDHPFLCDLFADRRFDHVFHFAASAAVIEKAAADPHTAFRVNTQGTCDLLDAVLRSPFPLKSFFYASTDKVYGDCAGESYDEESTPLNATGVYDTSKKNADEIVRTYHVNYGLPTRTLRLCNIFGPHDYSLEYRLVPRAMKAIYGSGSPRPPEVYFESLFHARDYLYIDDCVDTILLLCAVPELNGQVFNLFGCAHLTTPEMAMSIVKAAERVERRFDLHRADAIQRNGIKITFPTDTNRVLAIKSQHMTGERLRKAIGFEPRVSLFDGLERTVSCYRQYFDRPAMVPRPEEILS